MKLYYFDIAGRAEAVRILFKLAGMEFEDVRFSRDEWMSKYKAMSPTGQAPFMELDDGTFLGQSNALALYVGKLTGLMPEDPLLAGRCQELMMCWEDSFSALGPTFGMPDGEEKTAARTALIAPGGKMHSILQVIDKLLGASTKEFYLTDEPSLADVTVFCAMSGMMSGRLDGITKESLSPFTNIVALRNKMATYPKIQAMYEGTNQDQFKP